MYRHNKDLNNLCLFKRLHTLPLTSTTITTTFLAGRDWRKPKKTYKININFQSTYYRRWSVIINTVWPLACTRIRVPKVSRSYTVRRKRYCCYRFFVLFTRAHSFFTRLLFEVHIHTQQSYMLFHWSKIKLKTFLNTLKRRIIHTK